VQAARRKLEVLSQCSRNAVRNPSGVRSAEMLATAAATGGLRRFPTRAQLKPFSAQTVI